MRNLLVGAAAVAIALVLGACGTTYDREQAIADFEAEGIDRATAECIVDGIEENFSIERLESRGELTAEEEATVTTIATECLLGG
jgi:hypothetical protein